MGSVLRSVGASQGNIWSVAPFIPVGPSKNGLKKHEKSDFSKNARPIFLVFSHNSSILGMKEIPKFSRSVTYTLGWIWSGRGVSGLYRPPEPMGHSVRDTLPTLPIARAVQNKPPSLAAAWLQQLWCAFRPVEINSKLFPGFKYNH